MSFQENQMLPKWLRIMLLLPLFACVYFFGREFDKAGISALAILLILLSIIILSIILLNFCIFLGESGIRYSFILIFRIYEKKIYWNEITSIQVTPLYTLQEFGGLGIRYNPSTKFWGLIFKGNNSIEIIEKNHKKLKVSIVNFNRAEAVIKKYFKN